MKIVQRKYICIETFNTDSWGVACGGRKKISLRNSLILSRERQSEVLMWNNLTYE